MRQRLVPAVLALSFALTLPGAALPQHFGRNKVQYRSFDFKIIKTEHFDVYFYPQEQQAALDAARMVERSYARLSRVLQHEFRERKPLIVYASHTDFQQTNAIPEFIEEGTGGVTEPLKNRMILPFTGSYADFDHVLTHELVHAFQFDILYRRSAVAEATPFGFRPPLWFMEGMAEYLSLGRIDAHTAAWLRDAALSGYLRTIGEMSRRDDYLSYRFGQSLWAYIGSKWGDEVIGILLQKAPRVGLERAFQSTLGITLEELSGEWTAAVRKTYLPQLTEQQRPDKFAQRLTSHAKLDDPWFLAPAISPDGKSMTFLSQRDGFFFDLWLADARTGKVRYKLIESAREPDFESLRFLSSSAAFSADGRMLAFSAKIGGQDALYIYDVQRKRLVTKLRFDLNGISNPSWSPDGKRIVFTGMDGGLSDLFVSTLDGRLQRLTKDRYADLLPAWSPDGTTIAFSTDRGAGTSFDNLTYGNLRVALYHFADQRIELLPDQERGKNLNPVWAPDGKSLVWISDRTGTNDLYLFDLERRELSRLTNLLSGAIAITPLSPALSWAKEDGRLLFVYFEEAGYNIYALADPRVLPRAAVTDAPDAPEPTPPAVAEGPRVDTIALGLDPSRTDAALVASYYREGERFRPSAQAPIVTAAGGPVSVSALLDSAELALPSAGSFEVRDYNVKFTPDIIGRPTIGAQVGGYYGNGVYGGSYIALSDMLGNHNILLAGNVNGSFSDATFFGGYNFLKTRANWGGAVQQMPFYRYLGSGRFPRTINGQVNDVGAHVFMRDVFRMAQGVVSYPFSTFRRVEVGATAAYFKRDILYRGGFNYTRAEPFEDDDRIGQMTYFEPTAALVFDNSLFGWTGPIYGRRYRLQLSRTLGDFQFSEGFVDFRNYLNYKRWVVFAARFLALTRFGEDANAFSLFWGGPYFLRGYDGDSFDLDGKECIQSRQYASDESLSPCPVRDQLIGSSAALMNLELRFPVITELQLGFLGNFPPVDAVLFFDGGMAWDREICLARDFTQPNQCANDATEDVRLVWDRKPGNDPFLWREPLFSYGVGLRLNIFYTVLRFDYAVPLNRPLRQGFSNGIFSVSFGPSF